jgi:hypothetical protein
MKPYGAHDAIEDSLHRLTALAPDPDRAERVRASCHAQLGRSRRSVARTALITGLAARVLGPAIVGVLCVLYVAVLVATTLRLESAFR